MSLNDNCIIQGLVLKRLISVCAHIFKSHPMNVFNNCPKILCVSIVNDLCSAVWSTRSAPESRSHISVVSALVFLKQFSFSHTPFHSGKYSCYCHGNLSLFCVYYLFSFLFLLVLDKLHFYFPETYCSFFLFSYFTFCLY